MTYPYFQPAQTSALRILNKRYGDTQQNKKWSVAKARANTWRSYAWELAHRFANRTTIHGINRLLGESAGRYERTIWLLTVILALLGALYVCLILSTRFTEGKFQTIVDNTRMPVYKIYFPVITICNNNRLNWLRIEEAKARFLPTASRTPELENLFTRIVGSYDGIGFAKFNQFSVLENEPVELLNFVNFSQVFNFMTWQCEELLTNCLWRHFPMKCCDIFSKRRSKNGYCWSFNTLETAEGKRTKLLDPYWPWRAGAAGPGSGLNVRVLINPEKHYPNRTNERGLSVMITEPYVWHNTPFDIPENTQTMVEIEPIIYFYDNDTRSISSNQRECVFDDERNSKDFKSLFGYIYMIENCQSECHQEYLMRYCNCSFDIFFPPGQYPPCKAKDLLCLAKNNDYFLYSHQPGEDQYVRNNYAGMECKCFRNCWSLNYVTDVRPSFLPADVRGNQTYVDLNVHYRFETMMVYRTSLVFGWVDLMVAFGGIAGLFLGCSLISGMELAYFLIIEIPRFIFEKVKHHVLEKRKAKQLSEGSMVPKHHFGISNRILVTDQNRNEKEAALGDFMIKSNKERMFLQGDIGGHFQQLQSFNTHKINQRSTHLHGILP